MRRGREFYSRNYSMAMELHSKGASINEIAEQLNISYSAVYHWIRGIRKPETGNINAFEEFIAGHGPQAAADIKDKFPKHNEIFLTAVRRGSNLRRHAMGRKFGEYATWYFLPGQEGALKSRIGELLGKYRELRTKLAEMMGGA